MRIFSRSNRSRLASAERAKRPMLESLEGRLLLYSTTGGMWANGSRITYSFVPDGTSVGGTSSALFSTLNAKFSTATWQAQFQRAAAVWSALADINMVMVPDNGASIGSTGAQQGDSQFGDIRIGGIAQSSSVLGFALLPPPNNGGTAAGDIVLNTSQAWQINNDYDLQTVAIHEIGHALGMGHSAIAAADMYASYNGIKQSLASDDTSGIQSIYDSRKQDFLDAAASNNASGTATNINSWITSNAQIAIRELDITSISDVDWFKVVVPSSTTGTMVVQVQSANLSSLSPRVQVYNSSLTSLAFQAQTNTYGATASVTLTGVTAGTTYYIRASNANTGPTGVGAYGLLVNFGNQAQPEITPPNTYVQAQSDRGGGSLAESTEPQPSSSPGPVSGPINLALNKISNRAATPAASNAAWIIAGTLRGWGDYLTVDGVEHAHDGALASLTSQPRSADPAVIVGSSGDLMAGSWSLAELDAFGKPIKKG